MSTTWKQVHDDIRHWARIDWLNGNYDEETVADWASETADGCQYVIYYRHQDDLWCEGTITPVHEAEADIDPKGDIQDRIQACVFWAIYTALVDAAHEAMLYDGVMGVRRTERTFHIHGESMSLPVLETYRVPRERV